MKSRAFTLIELLVVVLIIGILSAIALPQYQKAVRKSQMIEGFVNLKTLVQASDAYYLANGKRPLDFTELDISFPGATFFTAEGHENSGMLLPNGSKYILDEDGYIEFTKTKPNLPELLYWYKPWPQAPYTCHWCCRSSVTEGKQMCLALGGKETGPAGGYTVYSLD